MTSYHSQFGEDRILSAIFKNRLRGFCVEVGANDGVNDSNTYHFEQRGWRCLLVEPNPGLCRKILEIRAATLFECAAGDAPGRAVLHIAEGADRAHGVSSLADGLETPARIAQFGFASRPVEVPVRTLDSMLEDADAPSPLDFISIDVEGFELAVLRGCDLARWRPRVLLLEDSFYFSNLDVRAYLAARGYLPFRRTGVNDWYAQAGDHELLTVASRATYALAVIQARARGVLKRVPGLRRTVFVARRSLKWLSERIG